MHRFRITPRKNTSLLSRAILGLFACTLWFAAADPASGQYLSNLEVRAGEPLFATYAAPMSRSQFVIDEGYSFRFDVPGESIAFTTDSAGIIQLVFKRDGVLQLDLEDAHQPPVVTASYNDLVRYHFEPFEDLRADVHFQVYSSKLALMDVRLTNRADEPAAFDIYPILAHSVETVRPSGDGRAFTFEHDEHPDGWTVAHDVPHVTNRQNVFLVSFEPNARGTYASLGSKDGGGSGTFLRDVSGERLSGPARRQSAGVVAFQSRFTLGPGESTSFRIIRGVDAADADPQSLRTAADALLDYDVDQGLRDAEERYARIPAPAFDDPAREATYWNAFSLMRQVMLPPEGESSYNYYVFSREPTWGWGHGGQVFHESLTMLAYVHMDPESAMNSQRVYMERQHDDGYINYRTGAYLNEVIETNGERTTSAPWYNWINWELFRETGDRDFLEDAYASGARFYEWWLENRDADGDGLAEWGAHAVLESVRDGRVAVWDDVDWPASFEAVDLNSMLVREARSLARMAGALGDADAAARWKEDADRRARAINSTFWDEETGFYYHVDRDDHDFTFEKPDDLKRQEIIGFLPLWAGVSTPLRAERLIEHLTNEDKFWRPFGVPSLAADDPYYNPMGYWNGPVWVEWQYLIFRGLLENGYPELAAELADRVIDQVTYHLADSHTFWELYSPDERKAGHHQTYIWTGLVVRMLLDLEETR